MRGIVTKLWDDYAAALVPATPGSTQYKETQKAFFAGAGRTLEVMTTLGAAAVSEQAADAAAALLRDMQTEVRSFADSVVNDAIKRRSENN